MNAVTPLRFSAEFVTARAIRDARDFRIDHRAIVVNVAPRPATIHAPVPGPLPPRSSTILSEVAISGELLVVIEVHKTGDLQRRVRELGWLDYFAPDAMRGMAGNWPQLYRSPQDAIGQVLLDLPSLLSQPKLQAAASPAEVRVNLWYSPAGTDCGIHNEHDFIEVHTQIAGDGRMQKFRADAFDALYEDQLMRPGVTNPTPFCRRAADGAFIYPWHQYRADTDCLWLAIEYHLLPPSGS